MSSLSIAATQPAAAAVIPVSINALSFDPMDDDLHWDRVARTANSDLPPLRAELRADA